MSDKEFNLYSELETALAYLEEDIQALGNIQSRFFAYTSPKSAQEFVYQYNKIQNAIVTLCKSMMFNEQNIRNSLKNNPITA